LDWDDLKILLALTRKGSARGAAQELGVSNSTVTRRLDDMEHDLHTRLFDRTPDGYRLTGAGEQVLPTAEHVEELILAAERKISGEDQELEGSIRVTMPPVQGMGFLLNRLASFAEQYPGIELELETSNDALDLSRREADIAIRVMPTGVTPPEYLIGRRMASLSASTYVHRDLLNPERPEDISHLTWIGKNPAGQKEDWLDKVDIKGQPVRHSIVDIGLLLEAVRARMGMAYIACFAVWQQEEVVRVPGANIVHHSDMWVLTHKDLRLSARMRVLREIIAEEFASIQHQLDSRPDLAAS
jgi:DNA-binding transcriptional LysR family regulator